MAAHVHTRCDHSAVLLRDWRVSREGYGRDMADQLVEYLLIGYYFSSADRESIVNCGQSLFCGYCETEINYGDHPSIFAKEVKLR